MKDDNEELGFLWWCLTSDPVTTVLMLTGVAWGVILLYGLCSGRLF